MSAKLRDLMPNFDGQVRLFPLSELVMFPSNLLPLHIFESRYQEMLEDAMQGDQLIAMATLIPGHEHDYYTRAAVSPVVCIGRVTDYQKTVQGTYDLMLLGLHRATIEHEIEPVRSFRRAQVKLIDDQSLEEDDSSRQVGTRLAERMLQVLPSAKNVVRQFLRGELSLASLTDALAFHVPLPSESKLHLLGEANAAVRAERLLASLPRPTVDRRQSRFPTDFSDN